MSTQLRRTAGKGLTVQAWFNVILAALVVLICGGAVAAAVSLNWTQTATDNLINRLAPAEAAASQLGASFLNQETGVRGYALSGDTAALEPYSAGEQLQTDAMAELRGLVSSTSELVADLDAIEQDAANWQTVFVEPILATTPTMGGRPLDPGVYERGKLAFDQLRAGLGELDQHLAEAGAAARATLAHAREIRAAVFVSLFVILLAASAAFAVLIRKAITSPLRRLSESSRRVALGNFGQQVDAGSGPADIRALAEDIEGMRQRIVAELELVRDRQARLEVQTAKLDAQTVELRRSNAELEQFAYVTSHDLQEPLRKVASFCQLLEKRYGDVVDERGRQYIDFAVDGAKRMQVLINDLLTFSRVGRVNDGFGPVSLDHALDKALANLSAAVDESGATIERPQRLPEIDGDATLLTMLWQNLIGNAIKFTRPESTPEVSISVQRRPDDMWLVSVQDRGIGIAEEFEEKIFVIFQRLHGRDEYTGTGIGLALCKKIVEYHGGQIWLDTTSSDGARFNFTLPVISEADNGADVGVHTGQGALT
ncbi:HAMP domain-containing protein [Rhodococcus hoagii]|nr:HAMP domain-containing protein [Prescottella equi]NKR61628.1 HAMP domain-containing protein [Prescottella equi]NKR70167.1 HAMP domain-containing protein [Prescottella equi]NKS21574.1 HAMP domain-containing protein [Prescottella equi]NKT04024.1 HAMP domain-containing protein [Prescottella equi]